MSVLPPGQARIFREVATMCPRVAATSMQRLILLRSCGGVGGLLVRDVVPPPRLIDAAVCSTVRPVGRAALLFGSHLEGTVVEAL